MAVLSSTAAGPRTDWRSWCARPVVAATLLAGGLSLAWALWLARDAGDLAAQYAWTAFVRDHPGSAYNLSWYGGIHPASYSVLSPYLMALIGVRTTGVAVAVAALVPRDWSTVRAGAWVYAAGVGLCWALPTPIGSNVERLVLLAGAAVLMCAGTTRERGGWPRWASYTAVVSMAIWTVAQPVANIVTTAPVTAGVADTRPLIDALRRLDARQGRVEVVPLRSHWEAAGLAPYVNLARGWNRQADVARNPLFYQGQLTAADYLAWLREWSVGYVVLSADEPDDAGVAEAKIITSGYPWLSLVWADAGWRVYRVDGVEPLAAPPATVTSDGPAAITLDVPRPGAVLIRIAWSPWLAVRGVVDDDPAPHACLAQHGRWTELSTPTAGTFTIEARYTLDRGTACPTTP
jgi:hypothetical protein